MDEREILLVEDSEDDIILTQRAFKQAGIFQKLIIAKDGEEALEYLFGSPDRPLPRDKPCPLLILLDINLPKISGIELLKRIRSNERTRVCPVVMLTSSNQDIDIIGGYALGANSYIRKPVDYNQFVDVVRQLGLYWLVLNVPAPDK